jgi:cyclohexanone monooxygenase
MAYFDTAIVFPAWLGYSDNERCQNAATGDRMQDAAASGAAETDVLDVLDVLIVGAGLSGIGAACALRAGCPERRFAILEAREAIGGTWDLFRYPGVRSDSDMHTLGYRFRPWDNPRAIADGPAILDYIRAAAREGDIERHIRFGHKVLRADWCSAAALWTVQAEHAGVVVTLRCRFLYLCAGYYDYEAAHRPAFEGEQSFRGTVVQPQFWPRELDWRGRRVVVVGSGATAVTLVPALAQTAAHVTMLQRSPTYVVARPAVDGFADAMSRLLPARLAYRVVRWKNVFESIVLYRLARRRPALVKRHIVTQAARQLAHACDARVHFTPSYRPWDQRICVAPDGDLFQAIRQGRASVATDVIERFTPCGLRLRSGRDLPADIVVLATGLQLKLLGGMALTVDGRAVRPAETLVYKGMMLGDVPNLALAFGYTNASWTLKADLTAQWVCRLLRHMRRHGHAIALARNEPDVAPRPFLDFTSGYVQRGAGLLPRQGERRPWQVYQNYLLDLLTIRCGRLADGVLRFGRAGSLP